MPSENVDGAVIYSLSRGRGLSLRFSSSVCLRAVACTLSPTGEGRIADGVKVV